MSVCMSEAKVGHMWINDPVSHQLRIIIQYCSPEVHFKKDNYSALLLCVRPRAQDSYIFTSALSLANSVYYPISQVTNEEAKVEKC